MGGHTGSDLEIASGYFVSDWKALLLDDENAPDWVRAIEILDSRIRTRFLDPIDVLIGAERDRRRKKFGFTILSIDCLLIETLQGFREGVTNHTAQSRRLFTRFLRNWTTFRECVRSDDAAKHASEVYIECRCALHHSGATGVGVRIAVSGPTFVFGSSGVVINRAKLHNQLNREFERYLGELRDARNVDLRRNFRTKMNYICG